MILKIRKILETRRLEAEEKADEEEYVKKLIKTDIDYLGSERSKELLLNLQNFDEEEYPEIIEKIEQVEERTVEAKREEKLSEFKQREEELKRSIAEKEQEEKEKIEKLDDDKQEILNRLEIYDNYVYKKDGLSNREIEALKSEEYTLENEFCVFEQKRINILIKPPTNHSVHHAFLVWSVNKLLSKNRKISRIDEKLSVDADIIFEYEKKMFAIEVETGSLLRKTEQMKEKVGYLNRKYPEKWIFLVSNKELYPKYKKFGLTATRKDFAKKLEKLLKSS
ncbi:Uncharacterised protein [uncultured archaeon]|nr:Uncharacterised protein [uncultured archaeon]